MSSTRQKLLACFGVLTLAALPVACAAESPETSATNAAFEAPWGCDPAVESDCGQNEFCKVPVGVCDEGGTRGRCTARPDVCAMILRPVCGCDDQTYNNQCEAQRAGMNVAYEGRCGPQLCGGPNGIKCPETHYCAAVDCDTTGFCLERPQTCDKMGTPACGCDRVTYPSVCAAHMAGVTLLAHNTCPTLPWVPSAAPELEPRHSRSATPSLTPALPLSR